MSPNRTIQVTVSDQKLCKFSLSILVYDIRRFRSVPWFHAAVILMDSHMLANCAFPVVATEFGERSLEAGENFKMPVYMRSLFKLNGLYTYVKLSRSTNFYIMSKLILIPDSER